MYRILIADDEPIERMVVTRKINKYFPEQFEIVQATNGREAVELFGNGECHILVLDIEMPGINGLEAARMIRERNEDCAIIFLTAFDDFSYAKKAISVHALDYLLKPVDDNEFIAVLEEAMRVMHKSDKTDGDKKLEDDCTEQKNYLDENVKLNAVANAIKQYIINHYKEDISLQDVAGAMNYSDAHFCKVFKQCFDKSFTAYLMEFRVEKAKELLADVVINIKDISSEIGYKDSNYFAKVFKRVAGISPSEYRLKVLKNALDE